MDSLITNANADTKQNKRTTEYFNETESSTGTSPSPSSKRLRFNEQKERQSFEDVSSDRIQKKFLEKDGEDNSKKIVVNPQNMALPFTESEYEYSPPSAKQAEFEFQINEELSKDGNAYSETNELTIITKQDKGKGRAIEELAVFNYDSYDEEEDEDWIEGGDEEAAESGESEIENIFTLEPYHGVDDTNEENNLEPISDEEVKKLHEEAREKGTHKFIKEYVFEKKIPLLKLLQAFDVVIPSNSQSFSSSLQLIPIIKIALARFLRKRARLKHISTIEDVANILKSSQNILILTGAGVSVSCGIPDFRSETGIYSRLDEYELDDPQQMFDIRCFRERPEIFYSFSREIFPSNFTPSPSHNFVKLLEDRGKLLRNYTQNIDTLEQKAGIKNVLNCHGSFATASCITCGYKCDGNQLKEDIFARRVPQCPECSKLRSNATSHSKRRYNYESNSESDSESNSYQQARSIMKPDITFFGEKLPPEFDRLLLEDREKIDLLIVMGSSLKVAPVSEIMSQIPHSVPQIVINRTPITHMNFDVQLLGDSDEIVPELCRMVGWELLHEKLPGGSALSKESLELARTGSGNEVEFFQDGKLKKERRIWKFVAPGVYTFKNAVMDERFFASLRCDQMGMSERDTVEENEKGPADIYGP